MEEVKKQQESEKTEKMSYEQLENVAHQLSDRLREAHQKLQERDYVNMFRRLDYLFQVVKLSDKFETEFVSSCVLEIQDAMAVKEDMKEDETGTDR